MSNFSTTDARSLPTDAETAAVPPRYCWLKRIMIASASLVVALVLLRLWWGWYANRLLQAEIDRIVAAGEPIYREDFDPKEPIPDDQNAVKLIEKAIDAFVGTTTSGVSVADFLNKPELFETDLKSAKELIEQNATVLALVRKSRGMRVHWLDAVHRLAWGGNIGSLSMHRALSKFLLVAAETEFRQGDHAAAVETLHDIFWHAHVMNSHPTMISNLTGWAIAGLGKGFIEEHAAALIVRGPEESLQIESSAEREQILDLIAFLLDARLVREETTHAELGERALCIEYLNSIETQGWRAALTGTTGRATIWDRVIYWPQRPLYVLDTIRAMRAKTAAMAAVREATWPAAMLHLTLNHATPALVLRLTRPLTFTEWGDTLGLEGRCLHSYFRFLAERRMAAIALGIRLYVVDHGRRPAQLGDLVPDYLAAIPVDPFSAEQAAIGYRVATEPQILYSVWDDGIDNGGTPRTKRRLDGFWETEGSDLIFYLDGNPKRDDAQPATPLPQTGDDNDDAQHDKGHDGEAQKPKA